MKNNILKATHEGKISIANIELNAAVLEDGTRVLSTTAMQRLLGVISNEPSQRSSKRLEEIITSKAVKPFIEASLISSKLKPIYCFIGNQKISAYEAMVLPELCDIMLKVRDYSNHNKLELGKRQKLVIERCDLIIRAIARVGIIALVDEATGYQYEREKNELQKVLQAYISQELLKWQKMFPDTFYFEIFRLNKWDFSVNGINKRPSVIGNWTNHLIYKQLPSGVLDELKSKTPKSTDGNYTARFFQSLTPDIGHPALTAQLYKVIGLMQISNTWDEFKSHFNRMVDRSNGQMEIDFDALEDLKIV